jgi:cytochrome P450
MYMCLFVIGYRTLLHPLRDYPGPLVAKFTDCYAGFYALSMRLHLATYQDHKKYGRVMRHGPNRLIFNSAQAFQGSFSESRALRSDPWLIMTDIYNDERITKSCVYLLTIQSNGIDNIFNTIDRRRHGFKRRIIGRVVTERSMRMFEPVMHEEIGVFLRNLYDASQTSRPVNMTQSCKRLGIDIVGHLAFGYALNTQTEPTYRFIPDGIAMGNYRANCSMQLPFLRNRIFDSLLHLMTRSRRSQYVRAIQHMIGKRMSMEKHAKNDLYCSVSDHVDTGGPDSISLRELWSNAVFFFPAG